MPVNIRAEKVEEHTLEPSKPTMTSPPIPKKQRLTPNHSNNNLLSLNDRNHSYASDVGDIRSGTPLPLTSQQIDGYASDTGSTRSSIHKGPYNAKIVQPDSFDTEKHFYPRVLNAQLHPMVHSFMKLNNDTIVMRYTHLHPKVNRTVLKQLLNTSPKSFQWAGCDLFNVTNYNGVRQMIVIETNSCPSGQKSFPQNDTTNSDGYHMLMKDCFQLNVDRLTADQLLPAGALAVVYDKNPMEASGYAEAMADTFNEKVYMVQFYEDDEDPPVKFVDGVMQIRDKQQGWLPIRAAFRYVTQRPWCRIPVTTRTYVLNPVVACLAGGRNKMAADKAYELFNKEIAYPAGLAIRTPETIRDVNKSEIPMWIQSMGGHAVVKNPYSNAGQGVYTITSDAELAAFMSEDHRYEKFIVQSLVGNSTWSSKRSGGNQSHIYFHTGTLPNKKGETFVTDLRMMIIGTAHGYQPVALYARRALNPLVETLTPADDSWAMLGTNLSIKKVDGEWSSETERLMMMDMKDFNRLGLGMDDLIDAYIQTVMAAAAIDKLADRLMEDGKFDFSLYKSLNSDDSLLKEIYNPNQ